MKPCPSILLIGNLDSRSGTGQYSESLYRNLTAVASDRAVIKYSSLFRKNLTKLFFRLKENNASFLVPVHSALTGVSHFASLLKIPKGYDLYHITDGTLGIIARFRAPSVTTIHDIVPFLNLRKAHYGLTDALMRASMRSIPYSSSIICDSNYVAGQLKQIFDLTRLEPCVIPLGVDHDIFKPRKKDSVRQRLGLPPNRRLILNVGSEEPRKNVPTLIAAFRKLLDDGTDATLVRVGARESSEVRHLLNEPSLKNKVMYLELSRLDLAELYASVDLAVFPSFYEGFGLPVLEAMASGCPVIASNAASVPEVIGDAGVLVDPFDGEGLVKCMTDVLAGRDRATELSALGLERSFQFSWTRTAVETWRVFESVLDRFGR